MKFKCFLFFQLLFILDLSAQSCIKTDHFFRSEGTSVYCLEEVLSATKDIKALSIQKSDLIAPFYGKPCLLDSILQHHLDSFIHKIQFVENLYLYSYLPPNLIELLAKNASIKRILLKPAENAYSSSELQQISLLNKFKEVSYFEGADSSLLFIECLQQFSKLDSVVWLNEALQNRHLGSLTNITTFIIDHYGDANYRWRSKIRHLYNFPPQLKTIYTEKISYKYFATKLSKCSQLEYLTDTSGPVIYPGMESMYVKSGHFPPPIPSLKELTLAPAPQYIPSNINLFSALQSLKIPRGWRWRLGLEIPSSLYQLSNLEALYIWTDHVSDSIRFLKKLKHLSIHIPRSNMNPISDSIQNLAQLESLLLHQEESGTYTLPSSIYALRSLKTLDIMYYALSDSIRFLKELRALTIISPQRTLAKLPDSLVTLKKLRSLDLSYSYMPEGKYPEQIYQFKNLQRLDLGHSGAYRDRRKLLMNVQKLKKLKKLNYLEFNILAIKNEIHYKRLYKALPEDSEVKLHGWFEGKAPSSGANFGIYTEYGWGQAAFTGIEFLYYINTQYPTSFVKKDSRFKEVMTKSKSKYRSQPNPFHFHTFSFAVEWNYLKNPDFLMGYRVGYNYSRVREPIAFQLDLIAYTNYNNAFDLRLAPRLAIVPIRTNAVYVSLYYSYKIPLIPTNEQTIVSRHTIGLSCRVTINWEDGLGFWMGW